MEIKAIETVYNGYRFRSRLEARWAVFFDAAGISYQYEPDGFETEDGKYLPDFYLPGLLYGGIYAEVKPEDYSRMNEIKKAVKVCCGATNKPLVILGEIPNITDCGIWIFNVFYYHPVEGNFNWRRVPLMWWNEDGPPVLAGDMAISRQSEKRYFLFEKQSGNGSRFPLSGVSCKAFEGYTGDEIYQLPSDKWIGNYRFPLYETEDAAGLAKSKQAFKKARMARFEHGENP